MAAVTVYKNTKILGVGALASGATSLTSWVPTAAASLTPDGASFVGRNVNILLTDGVSAGKVYNCRIIADNGSGTLTVSGVNCSGETRGNPYSDS